MSEAVALELPSLIGLTRTPTLRASRRPIQVQTLTLRVTIRLRFLCRQYVRLRRRDGRGRSSDQGVGHV